MTDTQQISNSEMKLWFDDVVENLRLDELLLSIDATDSDKKEFYETLIYGNLEDMALTTRESTSKYIIAKMVNEYFLELFQRSVEKPITIALELSNSKVLVWVQISDENEQMENALILSEAAINASYSKHGFYISSTIVEECDNLSLPPHYSQVKFDA